MYLPEMTQQFMACEYNAEKENSCIELIYPKFRKFPSITEF
jgi:mannose-1-phosphate guanylyltransferase